ncbi:sulfotransferase [Anaerolineales bacterium HSG25]|nr:sulfotransferase [Anaerolineales bacterium HSG25]
MLTKPIFIVGTGRCGSTIFHQIFAHHPQVAWLTRYCDLYPHRPHRNYIAMRLLDLPLPSRYVRKLIYPTEAYNFWDYHCMGFSEPFRDLVKEDVTVKTKQHVNKIMAAMLTEKRNRLLIKITGWPRLSFLKEIFPEAKFIHVYRDGRAVVNSLLNVRWWSGWHGPEQWRWGSMTPTQQEKWEQYDKSFVALAGIEWEILMDAQEQAKQMIPAEDLLEIRYEDFCRHPLENFKQTMAFSDLAWTPEFETTVRQFQIKSADYKWRKQLSVHQQNLLNDCLVDSLAHYGYE